jgi:hypothetical protein
MLDIGTQGEGRFLAESAKCRQSVDTFLVDAAQASIWRLESRSGSRPTATTKESTYQQFSTTYADEV